MRRLRKQLERIQSRQTNFNKPRTSWGDGRKRTGGSGWRLPGSMNAHKGGAQRAKR